MECPCCGGELEAEEHREPLMEVHGLRPRMTFTIEYRWGEWGLEAKESKRQGFRVTWTPWAQDEPALEEEDVP